MLLHLEGIELVFRMGSTFDHYFKAFCFSIYSPAHVCLKLLGQIVEFVGPSANRVGVLCNVERFGNLCWMKYDIWS